MIWQNKLTKAELTHVRRWTDNTLQSIKQTAKNQKEIRDKEGGEPCYICLDVARKLGLIE